MVVDDGLRSSDPAVFAIGECAEHYIRHIDGNTYQWVANKVREHFPDAKTSAASIAWYANKMKKDGRL